MELRQYFSIVLKWWWLILLSVLIAAGASYFVSSKSIPLYRSKTTLMVGDIIQNPDATSSEIYTGQQLASTYAQMVQREPVLKVVSENLGLGEDWSGIAKKVKASVIPQTQLIEIYVTDTDPSNAKILADAIALQLIRLSPSGRSQISQSQSAFIQEQLTDLNGKITAAKDEEASIKTQLDAANSANKIQDLQDQIDILETKITNWQSTYAELLKSLEGGSVNTLQIIEQAGIPADPISPNVPKDVILAAMIGFMLAVGGVFLIEYLDDSIQSLTNTENLVNLPTLAKIGYINGGKNDSKLIALNSPNSPVVDSFRMLRMNIKSISNWQSLRTLLITSVEPSVGKSLTVSNLAIILAQSGDRVILVDADMRKPSIHTLFGISNETGLKDLLLQSDLSMASCLQESPLENLKILTSGGESITSIEALGSERMKSIIDELSSRADVVLFDCPPAMLFSDPYLLGKLTNGVIIISRVGKTRTEQLKRVVDGLRHAGINLLGIILQERKTSDIYGYGYHYSKYYAQNGKKNKKQPNIGNKIS
jgi:polysaccharide biosynthesis transport protein